MSEELKPCPFCGQDIFDRDEDNGDITCVSCAYTFYDTSADNDWWNDRPIEGALQSEIARLKKLVDMKNDALDSYAEFYNQCLAICNMDVDTNPCTEADEIILETLRKGAKDE